MKKDNFQLRSCNSNCVRLRERIVEDNNFVEYGCELENVLGYKYDPIRDTIYLASSTVYDVTHRPQSPSKPVVTPIFNPTLPTLCLITRQVKAESYTQRR